MKKKIYIAGCGGMLGEAFHVQFKDDYIIKCTDKDVNEPWLDFLDFRDFEAYKKDVFDFRPDYLFHLGAYTDLEFCERMQMRHTIRIPLLLRTLYIWQIPWTSRSFTYALQVSLTAKRNCMTTGTSPTRWVSTPVQNIWEKDLWWKMPGDFSYAGPAG
jgi:hypothetical protein